MLFDPEDGMTLEQSIEIAWNNLVSPSMRARVLAVAEVTGRTRNSIILECLEMGGVYEFQAIPPPRERAQPHGHC